MSAIFTPALPGTLPQPTAASCLRAMFVRDLRLVLRRRSDWLSGLIFFVMVVSLFPLGVGPEANLLRVMAPGVVWVSALLALLLGLPRLFADDFQDGTLEQMLLSAQPLFLLVLGKVAAHWVASCLPLVVITPLLALQFGLSPAASGVLMLSLLVGTPVLCLVGAVSAALTLGLRGAGLLVALLSLPLFVPVLIFGAGSVDAFQSGLDTGGHFSLLGALLVLALPAAPLVTAAALRISID